MNNNLLHILSCIVCSHPQPLFLISPHHELQCLRIRDHGRGHDGTTDQREFERFRVSGVTVLAALDVPDYL